MKLRDFIVVAVVLDLLLGVFLFGLIGGFAGGVLLPESLRNKIVQVCGQFVGDAMTTSAVPVFVKENGEEDCDAVILEKKPAIPGFLQELRLTLENIKIVVEDILAEQDKEVAKDEAEYEASKNEYDESVRRYWAKSGQPMPK